MRRNQRNIPGHQNLPPLNPSLNSENSPRRADVGNKVIHNKYSSVREQDGERKNSSLHGHEHSDMTLLSAECYNTYDNSELDRYVDENDLESGRFMCSPAPREMSGDSITSSDSSESKFRPSVSGFPSITVDRCDERNSCASRSSTANSSTTTSSTNRSGKFHDSDIVTTNLLMPSPVMQRKYKNGRPVVITPNLQDLKAFSKSDGTLDQTDKAVSISPRSDKKRLDASFRPQPVSRPVIHASREVSREEVAEFKASRSPSPSPRRLRVRVTHDKQRARSTSDVNARR